MNTHATTTSSWLRKVLSAVASIALVAGLVPIMAWSLLAVSAAPATAAPAQIDIGTISVNMSRMSVSSTTNSYPSSACLRISPSTSGNLTDWVTGSAEAYSAHGIARGYVCPSSVNTNIQSTLSAQAHTPPGPITEGQPFLLASYRHYNRTVSSSGYQYFYGTFGVRLLGSEVSLPWSLWETTNTLPCPAGIAATNGKCDDIVRFPSSISPQTVTANGQTYRLVISGFLNAASPTAACPAVPTPGEINNVFSTAEDAVTKGCLYGKLEQVRTLTIQKRVQLPDGSPVPPGVTIPSFPFSSTSGTTGSPWQSNFTLNPTSALPASVSNEILSSERITISETEPVSDQWELTDISCVDQNGQPVESSGGNGWTASGSALTINNIVGLTTTPTSMTCTFTNTYTPKATLTLVKSVQSGSAAPNQWTLTANGPTPISGVSGAATVTNQRVSPGTYTLSESAGPPGYVQAANWSCTGGVLNGDQLTLSDGDTATCTVANRYATGSLTIAKSITGAVGGHTGGSTQVFSGTVTCTNPAATYSFTTTLGTSGTITGIPTGSSCQVTAETPPTGGFANDSYSWGTPQFGPAQTIPDGAAATVTLTNPIEQAMGYVAVHKSVEPEPGTAPGYTGTDTRTFDISYTCTLAGAPDITGTVSIPAGDTSANIAVPVGSTCSFTEATPTLEPGDFIGPSYYWNSPTLPADITVTAAMTVGSPAVATVTNTYGRSLATIQIAKEVTGPGAATLAPGMTFEVNYNCGGPFTGTVQLTAGETVTVADLPLGVTCTISETPPAGSAGLDPQYAWGSPTFTPSNGQAVVASPAETVTVTNPTVQLYGYITINKQLTGDVSGLKAGESFPMNITCDRPAEGQTTNYSATLSASLTSPAVTARLPLGTTCEVSEVPPSQSQLVNESYAWTATPPNQQVQVTTTAGTDEVTFTNTIERVYGSLTVHKVINNPHPIDTSFYTFSGTYSCSGNTNVTNVEFTGLRIDNSVVVADNILLGTTCVVTEKAPWMTNRLYAWEAPTYTPAGGVVTIDTANQHAEVTFTNTLKQVASNFRLTKEVTGALAGLVPGSQFQLDGTCVNPANPADTIANSWTIEAGQSVTPSQPLPVGWECTVQEATPPATSDPSRYEWEPVEWATYPTTTMNTNPDGSVTFVVPDVDPEDVARLVITNPLRALTGSLTVTKQVTGDIEGLTTGSTFPITVDCGADGVFQFSLGPAGSNPVGGIPAGATCAITEGQRPPLKDLSYRWLTPVVAPNSVTVTDGGNAAVTVTNEIAQIYGDVAIAKTVTDPDGVVDPNRTYPVSWECTYDGGVVDSGTFDVPGDGTPVIVGSVPVTSVCVVTGEDLSVPPSADPSYVWAEPVFSEPATVHLTMPASLTVTNDVDHGLGTLQVRKQVAGETDGIVPGSLFPVSYSCTSGSLGPITGTVNVPIGDDFTTLATDVPFGWTCQISEGTRPPLVDESYDWVDATLTPATVVLGADNPTGQITVVNTVGRVYSALGVIKELPGVPDGAALGDFTGTWSCQYGTEDPVTGTWTAPATGGPATLSGGGTNGTALLAGSECTVTEGDLPDLDHPAMTWNTPQIAQAEAISAGVTVSATVTNTIALDTATLTVTKRLADGMSTAGFVDGATVSGAWACLYEGVAGTTDDDQLLSGRWTLPATGGSTTAALLNEVGPAQIPVGSQCIVVEDTLTGDGTFFDFSYEWLTPQYQPENAQATIVADDSANVEVINSYRRLINNFTVTKQVVGNIANPLITYSGDWTCTYSGNPDTPDDDVTVTSGEDDRWQVGVGGTWTSPSLIVGSVCELTSEDTPETPKPEDPSWIWTGVDLGGPAMVVPRPQPVAHIEVTNTMSRVYGAFSVLKQVLEPDPGAPAATFTFDWACTPGDGTPELGGSFALAAGELANVTEGEVLANPGEMSDIPAGSICTVTEVTPPPASAAAGEWSAPTWTTRTIPEQAADTLLTPTPTAAAEFAVPADPTQTQLLTAYNAYVPAGYEVAKTADPVSGSTVLPGDVITYTLTVTPGPGGATGIVVTDELAAVLAHGELITGSLTPSHGSAAISGSVLTWEVGELPGSGPDFSSVDPNALVPDPELATLTYQVRVDESAWSAILRNAVTSVADSPCLGECAGGTEHHTPGYVLSKSADPASGSAVAPGQVITYTLHMTNPTDATMPTPVVTDDVSDVLDDASWLGFTGTVPGTAELSGSTLTWTAPDLPAKAMVTLSYQVRVNEGSTGGHLGNVAVPGTGGVCAPLGDGTPGDDTGEVNPCATTHEIPAFLVAKSSDPTSGTAVTGGDIITYTLSVTNTGSTPVTDAVVQDDLAGVLSAATYQGTTGTVPGTATLAGSVLTWTVPTLAAGETVTLSYQVKVNADARDTVLHNVASTPHPNGGCTQNCSTSHPIAGWSVSKSATPDTGSAVKVGDTITYTITVKVTPTAPASGIVVTDDLSGVLGKAVLLTGSLTTSTGTASVTNSTLTWNVGTVPASGTATLTYQVIVQSVGQGGTIKNVVTASGDVPYLSCDPCTTQHQVGKLPVTGADSAPMAGLAAVLLASGLLLVLAARWRRAIR